MVATDLFAFGDEVPAAYVDFVDEMLSATPFEVVAEFFPSFRSLDKFDSVEVDVAGADHRHLRHRRTRSPRSATAASCTTRIAGSTLLECEDAGHMVILERHDQVNAALDQLISAAAERVGAR